MSSNKIQDVDEPMAVAESSGEVDVRDEPVGGVELGAADLYAGRRGLVPTPCCAQTAAQPMFSFLLLNKPASCTRT